MKGSYTNILKKQFGFMFTFWGRILFMIFIASLLWAAEDSWWIATLLSVLTIINAILNGFLISSHPDYHRKENG